MIIQTKVPHSEAKSKRGQVAVSEANLRRAARRLLGGMLVSPEVEYIQRVLGTRATQDELDAKVIAVRRMPWSSIVVPD